MFSPTCPLCGALVGPEAHGGAVLHAEWHYGTRTLVGWSTDELVRQMNEQRRLAELVTRADDETPTQKFPPITETVLRRPPPVPVRELRGPELLRALAQEIERDLQDDEDQS